MSTIAVYTFKKEGEPMPPQPHNASLWKARGFDFICFVTRKGDMPDFDGVWYIEELPISWNDPLLNAALPKLNPQSVLEGYEYSLWLDGNVAITDDSLFELCKKMQADQVLYADLKHKSVRSVYSYAWRLWREDREPFKVVYKAVTFLLGKGIGPFAGFHDTSVMGYHAHFVQKYQ